MIRPILFIELMSVAVGEDKNIYMRKSKGQEDVVLMACNVFRLNTSMLVEKKSDRAF
jgi:hypothetical protein